MSMPVMMQAYDEADDRPMLRLAGTAEADVAPTTEPAESSPTMPRVVVRDGKVFADDGASLPAVCVRCGDTVDLLTVPTPRGDVRISICREHAIGSAALGLAGTAILAVWGWTAVMSAGSSIALGAGLFLAAAGLIVAACPVWTWRRKGSSRRLFRVGETARREIEKASAA